MEQLTGFLLLSSCLQFLVWIFLSYFTIVLNNRIFRGDSSCVKVHFLRQQIFSVKRHASNSLGQFIQTDHKNWEILIGLTELQRIPQITYSHDYPWCSHVVLPFKQEIYAPQGKRWVQFQRQFGPGAILHCDKLGSQQAMCYMLTLRHATDTLSISTHKTTSLQHYLMFHAPYTENLLAFMHTHLHTHIHILWSQRCYHCLYALSRSAVEKLPQKGARQIALSVLFRHSLVPSCTILAVLEETSFLGALQ